MFAWERRKGFDVALTFAHAPFETLEAIGLLHSVGSKQLACPAVMIIGPGGILRWATAGRTNADRVPENVMLDAIEAHMIG